MAWRLDPFAGLWALGVAALAALLGLVAGGNPVLALLAAFGVTFVVLAVQDLALGLAAFTLVVSSLEVLPGLGDVSAAKLAGIVLVLAWLGQAATRVEGRRELVDEHPGFTALALLLVLWAAVSALWAEYSREALTDTVRMGLNVLLIPIVFAALRGIRDVRRLVGAFVMGVLLSTAYGLLVAPESLDALGRLSGAGEDPNYLAMWLVVGAVLALCLAADREIASPWRALWLLAAVVSGLAMLLTASRTGMIAAVAVYLAALFFSGPGRRLPVALGGAAVTLLCVLYFVGFAPDSARERLTANDGGSGRTSVWQVGWRMVEANPVKGVGMGNFKETTIHYLIEPGAVLRDDLILDEPKRAHNVYLELLAELGIIGIALFLGLAAFCMACAGRAAAIFARARRRSGELLSRGALFSMVALMAGSFFISIQYTKPIWMLLGLGPALLGVARAHQSGTAGR